MGLSGRAALKKNLLRILNENEIDFSVINGENAADDGKGITKKIAEEFFTYGIDVITSGNHIWDKKETTNFIEKENRLLRPANLVDGSPGRGYKIYFSKDKRFKIGVINLMGNVFMRKTDDVFKTAKEICNKMKLKKDVDFLVVDFHGEITSEKMAVGHFLDGKASLVAGTHTHVPTNDARILSKGTAYITDAGMCGDYDSVIGMDKNNSIKRFLKEESKKHFPSNGESSLCGVVVDVCIKTGLALNIKKFITGGVLNTNI